jgi:glucose dehydrogenase
MPKPCIANVTIVATLAGMLASCSPSPPGADATRTGSAAPPQTPQMRFISEVPNGEWRLPAGDYANTRYSALSQINTGNVSGLKIVTSLSTGIARGHEGQPLIVNGTMYIVTPYPNNLIAVDLSKPGGALRWVYEPHPDPVAVGKACCDVVNRGASYADGKIIYNLLDAHTVAVDAESGAEREPGRDDHDGAAGHQGQGDRRQQRGRAGGARLGGGAGDCHRQGDLARLQHRTRQRGENRRALQALLCEGPGHGSRRDVVAA